jgi:hypothetical protein
MVCSLHTVYNLNSELVEQLKDSADRCVKSIKLNLEGESNSKRNAALVFARNFDSMDKTTAENILKLFSKGDTEDE